jgi:hypothetical protein
MKSIHQNQLSRHTRTSTRDEGFDFVRCRICGDHRRVISGRHLSKHGTDREEYMEEYGLSPDELVAKDFRIIQSSRRGYQPYGKREWIAAIKRINRQGGSVFAAALQKKYPYLYQQGIEIPPGSGYPALTPRVPALQRVDELVHAGVKTRGGTYDAAHHFAAFCRRDSRGRGESFNRGHQFLRIERLWQEYDLLLQDCLSCPWREVGCNKNHWDLGPFYSHLSK